MKEANKDILRHLKFMLEDSPVESLKRSLEEMFKAYLLSLTNDTMPFYLKETIQDYYNMIDFLDSLETTE